MGLFGGNFANVLQTIGAGISDFESGGGNQNLMAVQKMREAQAQQMQKAAAQQKLMGLFGSQYGAADPMTGKNTRTAGGIPSIADPRVAQVLMQAEQAGVDPGSLLEIMKANQPNINVDTGSGEAYNQKDAGVIGRRFARPVLANDVLINAADPANIERHIPKLGEGMTFGRDATGRAIGVQDAPGYVDTMSRIEGAKSGAQAAGKAPYEFVDLPDPSGAPRKMSVAGAAGGDFRGRAPEDTKAAEARATAQAAAAQEVGGVVQTAQSALDTIAQIRTHPGLKSRVGFTAVLPAIPGTPGKDFDTLVEQAKGQVFLQAYSALKGGGQITEREGQAAQQAIARLNQAQTQEGFAKALDDLEGIIRKGVERAEAKAGQGRPKITPEQARAELARRRGGR